MIASPLITKLLTERGIPPQEQNHFLHPDYARDILPGMNLLGMSQAVERLQRAIASQETIVVFGDYDADGVPATALCVRCLQQLGARVIPVIPLRSEGYGLSIDAVERLLVLKSAVVLTVDNGSVARHEVAALAAAGVDVLIADHHEADAETIANAAYALINPKQPGCPYPFKELCGCALAWKLMRELYKALGKSDDALKWELDLVALSTVADLVPLVGENRALVHFGLKTWQRSRNLGLRALADVAGVKPTEISAGDLGFKIGPRLNAPSRMHADAPGGTHAALSLLLTQDPEEAAQLALYLQTQNTARQSLVQTHIDQALELASQYEDHPVLVLYHQEWSTGVIGLVASKLVEKYRRPAIVLAPEHGVIKGSVRSVGDAQALALLQPASTLLERFGGHAKAAGLSFLADTAVEDFRVTVVDAAMAAGHSVASLAAAAQRQPDLEIALLDASLDLADELALLEPFGLGFARPRLRTRARLTNLRRVGKEKQHLSCFLEADGCRRKAIAFGLGELAVQEGADYQVDFTLEAETWNDVRAPQCFIEQIVPAH